MDVAALVDTNVLVYRFDPRFPDRQKVATEVLRRGIAEDSVRVPHQAIMEFVAVVTRPLGGAAPLLSVQDALREAEEMLKNLRGRAPAGDDGRAQPGVRMESGLHNRHYRKLLNSLSGQPATQISTAHGP